MRSKQSGAKPQASTGRQHSISIVILVAIYRSVQKLHSPILCGGNFKNIFSSFRVIIFHVTLHSCQSWNVGGCLIVNYKLIINTCNIKGKYRRSFIGCPNSISKFPVIPSMHWNIISYR
jgi:hypothetical protein